MVALLLEVVPRWDTDPMSTQHRRIQVTEDREHAAVSADEAKRQKLLEELADDFRKPETAPWDWEALREGKRRAWPIR